VKLRNDPRPNPWWAWPRVVAQLGLRLTVTDEDIGITPGARRSGLANLQVRATQLGVTCTIEPGAAGGTTVLWQVPQSDEPAVLGTNEPGDVQGQT
jgi:hypothetical protein